MVDLFCLEVEPLLWVDLELLLFCLDWEEPLLDLLSDLEGSDFCSDLFPEDLEARVSRESSPFHSQYCELIAWTSFWSPARVVSFSWWTISLYCIVTIVGGYGWDLRLS